MENPSAQQVQFLTYPSTSDEAARWRNLKRRWDDWRMVWAGALSISFFLGLGSVYTFTKLHDNPHENIESRDLWVFQVLVWLGMVLMAFTCVVAQRRVSSAEEDMAQMLVADDSCLSWNVTQSRWDRFKAAERKRIDRTAYQLSPLAAGLVIVVLVSIASVMYDSDIAEVVFAVTITMELMLGTVCVLWFIHAQIYRLGQRRETVHVVLFAESEDDAFGNVNTRKDLFVVMGDRLAIAAGQNHARMRRCEYSLTSDPPEWELFVGSFAFPIAEGEEEFVWARMCSLVSHLPQTPQAPRP